MKNLHSLEEYIKKITNEKSRNTGAVSYGEWIAKRSTKPTLKYSDAILKAQKKRSVSYGAMGEKLASRGLLGSGYEKRLDAISDYNATSASQDAARNYQEAISDEIYAYSQYLDDVSEERGRLYDTVFRALKKDNVLNYESAFNTALKYGLNESEARYAAENATKENRDKTIKSTVNKIISERLSDRQARILAEKIGLSEDDTELLERFAYEMNNAVSLSNLGGNYLEYLEKLEQVLKNNKKQKE